MTHDEKIKFKQVSRLGVYAVALYETQVLLIEKKRGPYKGLWDLPGGGVEFGESPEMTLRREFLEEVGMKFDTMEILSNLSHRGLYKEQNYDFHHIGLIYYVEGCIPIKEALPEETFCWQSMKNLDLATLTPLARDALNSTLQLFWTHLPRGSASS